MRHEVFQHMAVCVETIRPKVVPHAGACRAELLLDERQRHFSSRSIGEFRKSDTLRLFESLRERCRKPGVTLCERTAHTKYVHDWKHAVFTEPVHRGRCWIWV